MDVEKAAKFVQRIQRDSRDFATLSQLIGDKTGKDTPQLRNKLERCRREISRTDTQLQDILKNAAVGDRAWDQLKGQYKETKKAFDAADATARRKEKENPMLADGSSTAAAPSGGGGAAGEFRVSELKRVDMSELATEEAIQAEKLQGVREIEQDMRELKTTYQEFNELVNTQQGGIDTMQKNVQQATVHVEKGVVELKEASNQQKQSRSKLCIVLLLLVVVIVIIVVVVFVAK